MIANNTATKLATVAPKPASRMTLAAVKKGKLEQPLRVVLFGQEGVGKSTFGASAPSPIFLCAESGTHNLDVARFPTPTSWAEVLEAVDVLTTDDHDYKTLVVDTLDWLEPLVFASVIASSNVDKNGRKPASIEEAGGGFGKGYVAAVDQWRLFVSKLEKLQVSKRMHVILLAHTWIKAFANPEGDNFDRYELKIDKRASGKLKEWADAVLFATWDKSVIKEKGAKAKGISNGARIIHTEWSAAFDAKNRYGLPNMIPLSWDEFWTGVQEGRPATFESMIADARALAAGFDGMSEKVETLIAKIGDDAGKAAQILSWVRGKIQLTEEKGE